MKLADFHRVSFEEITGKINKGTLDLEGFFNLLLKGARLL